jgi:16S rRNA processing protein RimM
MASAQRLGPAFQTSRSERPTPVVRLGYINGSHGLHGAVRMRLDNPDSIQWESAQRIFLRRADAQTPREYRLIECTRINRNTARLRLDGIDDAQAALALKGMIVLAATEDLPALSGGEFYYFQIVGAEVRTADGRYLGCVAEIFSNGANDVCAVRVGAREVLIPIIADIVRDLDLERRIITVEAVPGLIE